MKIAEDAMNCRVLLNHLDVQINAKSQEQVDKMKKVSFVMDRKKKKSLNYVGVGVNDQDRQSSLIIYNNTFSVELGDDKLSKGKYIRNVVGFQVYPLKVGDKYIRLPFATFTNS